MTRTYARTLLVSLSLALAAPAYSAGYIKIDGIDGESTDKSHATTTRQAPPAAPRDALRTVPTAPADSGKKGSKKGNVQYEWKVEEGRK